MRHPRTRRISGIDLKNRGEQGSGHGWTMGWGVVWNSFAPTLLIQNPPGAANWSIGTSGQELTASMPSGPDVTTFPFTISNGRQ